jgi:hypothetical protein
VRAAIRKRLTARGVFDHDRLPPNLEAIRKYQRINERKAAATRRRAERAAAA